MAGRPAGPARPSSQGVHPGSPAGWTLRAFTFISSAYIPVSTMPSWMQPVANYQPVTYMVNAVRCLTQGPRIEALLGHTTAYYVVGSLLWTAGIIAVFAPLAIARFARR